MQPSEHIRARQTREMLRAARHSYYLGRTLNSQTVIDFGLIEAGEELRPYRQMQDIRKRVWSWWDYARRTGRVSGPFLDWVTWEAPNGKHHANWFVAVPDELMPVFQGVIDSRCRKVLGERDPDTVFHQPMWNTNGAMFYVLKGTEPDYAEQIGIDPEPQGAIYFRRAYAARALGRAARDRDWSTGRTVRRPGTRYPKPREVREMVRLGNPPDFMARSPEAG